MTKGEGSHHILRLGNTRMFACPLCQQALTVSRMGIKAHLRGKHKEIQFDERRKLEDSWFSAYWSKA